MPGSTSGQPTSGNEDADMFDRVRDMQEQAQMFNMQYLELQEHTQREARRFTTLSNVAKAEHDNAKSILRNVSS